MFTKHATYYSYNLSNDFSDDIFRRRLLIEGDGGGDDKKFGSLLKTFLGWANETETVEEK